MRGRGRTFAIRHIWLVGALIAVGVLGLYAAASSASGYRALGPVVSAQLQSIPTVTAQAAKTAPRGVYYGGTTSQQEPFVLVLGKKGTRVVHVANEATATCQSGQQYDLRDDLRGALTVNSSGRFGGAHNDAESLSDNMVGIVQETFTGKITGTKVSGVLKVHVDVIPSAGGAAVDTCDISTTFKLISSKGREFVGVTSQKAPVVVELNASGKKVSHFHIGWRGSCTTGGSVNYGEFLSGFPLTRGTFGDVWVARMNEPTGEYEVDNYLVSGKVKGATASGRFQLKISYYDAADAETNSCDSGMVTWKATSG